MNLFFPWKRAYAKHYYVSTSFEKKSLHFQKVLHKTSLHFEGFWEKKSLTFHIYLKIVPILSCKHPIQHSNFAHWSITHLNSMIKLQFKDSDINKCSKYSWWNRTKKLSITTKRVLHDYIFCSAFSNKKLQHSETFFWLLFNSVFTHINKKDLQFKPTFNAIQVHSTKAKKKILETISN